MAHWGIAYAVGPNYNKPWEAFEPEEKAETVAKMQRRQPRRPRWQGGRRPATCADRRRWGIAARRPVEDFAPWNDAFAAAMRGAHRAHPDDLDIAALFAEALMNRTPWQLWDLPTGQPAEGADTLEAKAVLERAFAAVDGAWDHPGCLHMYIHLMEMSPHPELRCATATG
jgi:hypothetical protein